MGNPSFYSLSSNKWRGGGKGYVRMGSRRKLFKLGLGVAARNKTTSNSNSSLNKQNSISLSEKSLKAGASIPYSMEYQSQTSTCFPKHFLPLPVTSQSSYDCVNSSHYIYSPSWGEDIFKKEKKMSLFWEIEHIMSL